MEQQKTSSPAASPGIEQPLVRHFPEFRLTIAASPVPGGTVVAAAKTPMDFPWFRARGRDVAVGRLECERPARKNRWFVQEHSGFTWPKEGERFEWNALIRALDSHLGPVPYTEGRGYEPTRLAIHQIATRSQSIGGQPIYTGPCAVA